MSNFLTLESVATFAEERARESRYLIRFGSGDRQSLEFLLEQFQYDEEDDLRFSGLVLAVAGFVSAVTFSDFEQNVADLEAMLREGVQA